MSAENDEGFGAAESSRREFITKYGTMAFAAPVIASFTLDGFARHKDHDEHDHPKHGYGNQPPKHLCENQPPQQLCENQTYQESEYPKQLCENQTQQQQCLPDQALANGT
jgi:hypothetical protein